MKVNVTNFDIEHSTDDILCDLIKEFRRAKEWGEKDLLLCKIENYLKEKDENVGQSEKGTN